MDGTGRGRPPALSDPCGIIILVDEHRIDEQRSAKAARIAAVLRARGRTPADAARMDRAARREIERAAQTRPASDDTWRVVVEMLAGSARERALCVTCGLGDPDGEPGPRKAAGHEGPCAR